MIHGGDAVRIFSDQHWPALLAALPATFDLNATARASGALVRRRAVGDAAALLRLALGYGPGGLSLSISSVLAICGQCSRGKAM